MAAAASAAPHTVLLDFTFYGTIFLGKKETKKERKKERKKETNKERKIYVEFKQTIPILGNGLIDS